jgi:ceramide glucosyltransferase
MGAHVMMPELFDLAGLGLAVAASFYAVAAWLLPARVAKVRRGFVLPPRISILKPLYGFEARLEANLTSLARSATDNVQVLCGVRDPNDAALAVVARVKAAFPQCRIEVVVDPRVHGHNLKVSNLINLYERATGDVIVIADSDILVSDDYVARVTAPLSDSRVGLVTCMYRGRASNAFISRLGSLFIDTWFIPSVRVASHLGDRSFGFGATLALRRDTLEAIGGLACMKDQLADDYWLGELIHRLGLSTVLSRVIVETDIAEASFSDLWLREIRWMRTIRSLNPVGFAATFITHTFPMLLLALLIDHSDAVVAVAAIGLLARIGLQRRAAEPALWLLPLRDTLSLIEWAFALTGRTVTWRDATLSLESDPAAIASASLPNEADLL